MLFLALILVFLLLWGALDLALPRIWLAVMWLAKRFAALSMRWGLVQRVVQRSSKFRDYLPVFLIVLVGVFVCAWAGDQFMDLAELVHSKSTTLQQADLMAHDWAVGRRTAGATLFFATMSNVGGPVGASVIAGLAFGALLVARRRRQAVYLLVTAAGGGLLDWELKRYFARARPAIAQMLRHAHGYSFPSGHAMGSAVVFGALAYLAFRTFKAWRMKAAAIALSFTMILSIALSRVYLGVHWISDVAAGVACGLLWVSVTTVAYETFRRISRIRAAQHE